MADRPTPPDGDEIEVTPEMIEAGADAVRVFDGGYMETAEFAAERIYRVMVSTKAMGLAYGRSVLDGMI
jgi:hypothetical protein